MSNYYPKSRSESKDFRRPEKWICATSISGCLAGKLAFLPSEDPEMRHLGYYLPLKLVIREELCMRDLDVDILDQWLALRGVCALTFANHQNNQIETLLASTYPSSYEIMSFRYHLTENSS